VKNTRKADKRAVPATYHFYNLGCPKNLVDAERAAAGLEAAGWSEASVPEEAGLLVVTTCAFIEAAEEESVDQILEVASAKEDWQRLAVLGCLVTREGARLQELLPEVDIFLDVSSMTRLADAVSGDEVAPAGRKLFTPAHTAYLKISEGCSNRCSYCTIPGIRGDLASRPGDELLREAASLASGGARELVVIAQDTTAWGTERGGGWDLLFLLECISRIEEIDWIRLMYLHPARIDPGALAGAVRNTKVIPYFDIPVQHASDSVLSRMGRGYTGADLRRIFDSLRKGIDGLVLRTTLMTGFPGETDEDFDELASFLEEQRFDHAGIFRWSPERGTPASSLGGRVPGEVVSERLEELSSIQFDISADILSGMEGREIEVLVDGAGPGAAAGRWYGQAPEIDGITWLTGSRAPAGSMGRALVERSEAYDLFAAPEGDFI
jgi:ribosomal protein S12 methylthiotransferase RimO